MKIIAHRKNTSDELAATPTRYGVEVDIRSHGDRLIIHHDPFKEGEGFESWIAGYRHGTLILNVKEEGLESRLLEIMRQRNLSDFFFLDQSFPFLVKWAKNGERRCAVRVSEFEAVDTALTLAGMVDWAWIDCFTKFPLTAVSSARLGQAGFKLCLVSPELQGRSAEAEIPQMRAMLATLGIDAEAVCTKRPDLWEAAQ